MTAGTPPCTMRGPLVQFSTTTKQKENDMHGPIRTVRPEIRSTSGAAVVDHSKTTVSLAPPVEPEVEVEALDAAAPSDAPR